MPGKSTPKIPRNCEQCGSAFLARPNRVAKGQDRFCSVACRAKARIVKMQTVCEQCGTSFEVLPTVIAKGLGRFCSKACFFISIAPKRIPRTCEHCQQEFLAIPSEVRRGGARFCSVACFNASVHTAEMRTCEHCGKEFRAIGAELRRGRARFCSHPCSAAYRTVPTEVRFWKFVQKGGPDECWIWTGGLQGSGYGQFNGENWIAVGAHRFSYLLHGGELADNDLVLHTCPGGDNKRCVNPRHLRPGSHKDNRQDSVERGQLLVGERHYSAVLTENIVREMRILHQAGVRFRVIAERFGVNYATAYNAIIGKSWKHVA